MRFKLFFLSILSCPHKNTFDTSDLIQRDNRYFCKEHLFSTKPCSRMHWSHICKTCENGWAIEYQKYIWYSPIFGWCKTENGVMVKYRPLEHIGMSVTLCEGLSQTHVQPVWLNFNPFEQIVTPMSPKTIYQGSDMIINIRHFSKIGNFVIPPPFWRGLKMLQNLE